MPDKYFFVYELIDPRNKLPFYIGKGSGLRVRSHYRPDISTLNTSTRIRIAEIQSEGLIFEHKIVRHDLTEDDALNLETSLIAKYGRVGLEVNGILTNKKLKGPLVDIKRTVFYSSVQVRVDFKQHIINYCDKYGLKISTFIENACRSYISGSMSGSLPPSQK